ncbi:3-dehydroquinate synthase [Chloroherpeton thalassium ATCC 35110]|uniref:3-dehydroquinate synthase n=1 Tax=Chloroherpeton thalassium (strain ATCC 35110 / GB-78) TaxID=517418 RepID=B3QSZ8_CHLT3|nr:3-dehydroquinate synthase [Chloroherpeton thalassium]ACF12641.1 3-dehydroquinate synthase [Chloroherpeton thalassium ATCC 35110]
MSSKIVIETPAIAKIGNKFAELGRQKKVVVLYDKNTAGLFEKSISEQLEKDGFIFHNLIVPASEASKSFRMAYRLYGEMLEREVDRSWSVVAVGGGVVGDLGGFIAASFMRGVPVVQVPTTLLAMTDSAIGGKVAINHPMGKNMIGFFHEPVLILIDPNYLRTLPNREIFGGLAEVLKYALILDGSFLDFMEDNFQEISTLVSPYIDEAVKRSVNAKVKVVTEDFRETTGLRAILNFGHTFGHSLEKLSNYKALRHGEAVLVGMACATQLSMKIGNISSEDAERICAMIQKFPYPKRLIKKYFLDVAPETIIENMRSDKKKEGKHIRFALLKRIGNAYLHREEIAKEDIIFAIEAAKPLFA